MALSDLVPAFERSRKAAIAKSTRAALQLVPALNNQATQRASNRIFYGLIVTVMALALISLLGINIALSNDAVRIRSLKLEVIEINEAREAASREVALLSTPETLAKRAKELGMIPGKTPVFIDLNQVDLSASTNARGQR